MQAKCLCGAVTLDVEHNNEVHACHCGMCRNWGGGASFSLEAVSKPKIEGGENIAHYPSSEWGERGFCKQCGTHLYYHLLPNDIYYVYAGLFKDYANFALNAQIYIDCKAPYYELANDTPKLTEKEFLAQFGGANS